MQVQFHVHHIAAVALRGHRRRSICERWICCRWRLQPHGERRQSFAVSNVRNADITLVVPELQDVLLVQPTAEFFGEVLGVFRAGMEGKQSVEVREDRSAKVASRS